jgi:hypothetical protein
MANSLPLQKILLPVVASMMIIYLGKRGTNGEESYVNITLDDCTYHG